jgi:hypothetical protein
MIISILFANNLAANDTGLSFPIRNEAIKSQEKTLLDSLSIVDSKSYKDNDIRVIIKQ